MKGVGKSAKYMGATQNQNLSDLFNRPISIY